MSTDKKKPTLVVAKLDENSTDEELQAFIDALYGETEDAPEGRDRSKDADD